MKKVLRIIAALLLAGIIGGCIYLDSLMPIITGYGAKNMASAVFVSGRDPETVKALDLNFSFIKFDRFKIDYENKTVTSRFLWRKATALYREGYGVTLLRGAKAGELKEKAFPLPPETVPAEPLPKGDSLECAELASIAEELVDERDYNGHPFAFVVLHKGKVVAERYDEGIGPDTKLLSWSMGKSFTNALIGIMSGDGLVDIDAPVDIPEWQGDGRKAITLRNLMQMQSGLEWNEDYGNRSDVNLMLHVEEDMGLYALSKPLEYEPGTHWYYSSGSTNIVMRWLRGKFASDKEFLGYVRERLFAPLGIRNAVFETDMSGTPVGSSYLYVTAMDYARFGQMFLDDGCVGAVANGVPETVANQIFDQMESFASYAFNKSHAAAYALVAYQTAYLKTHYFGDYMAALMTSVISETPKLMSYVEECRNAGVDVLPPDVNTGEWGFSYHDGQLRFGLLAIKGLGKGLIDRMVMERRKNGKFAGFVDFCRRMSACGMNKRILESLILSGALDRLDCNRRQMMLNYEFVMESVSGAMDAGIEGQMSLFGDGEISAEGDLQIAPAPDYEPLQKMQMERSATGLYLSGHPLESMAALAKLLRCVSAAAMNEAKDKTECSLMCMLQSIKKYRTKSGEDMAFVTLEDTSGEIEALVFPKLYSISAGRLLPDKVLYVSGQISRKDDENSLICGSILSEDDFPQMLRQRQLCIKIGSSPEEHAALQRLPEICRAYPGETEIVLYLTERRKYAAMKPLLRIEPSQALYEALCKLFRPEAIGLIRRLQK